LHDPRREHNRLHNLWDIIALTICGVIAGADSWVDVESYGEEKQEFLETFLELPNGIPSHDTIGRVFSLLDPAGFQSCFLTWVGALVEATAGRIIAVDGKTLRHSFDHAKGQGALHLVSAWATANRLVLGQRAVDQKSNEITAIPELLKILDLHGAIVTIDAMGCQKDIATTIAARGGHYVLALKENHELLHAAVLNVFQEGLENHFHNMDHHAHQTVEKGHGRKETRHYHVVPAPPELLERHPGWTGLRTLGMVFSERQVGKQEPSCEVRYFLVSLPPKVKTFARAVRSHWGIENSLHWVLDMSFREDESRLRKDHGPENLALLRRMTASLLQREATKVGVACKRKKAGWSNDYLIQVLSASLG
jgi:predicted transposase YbfD/YdcC